MGVPMFACRSLVRSYQQPPTKEYEHEDCFRDRELPDTVPLIAFDPLDVFEVLFNFKALGVGPKDLLPGELMRGYVRQQEPWFFQLHAWPEITPNQSPVMPVVCHWRIW